jgi:hypothetical protein
VDQFTDCIVEVKLAFDKAILVDMTPQEVGLRRPK